MSRCPLCGSKDCCGGYYQEVQDVLVETLEGAKWLIECYVANARNLSQNVRRAFEDGMNGDRRRCG